MTLCRTLFCALAPKVISSKKEPTFALGSVRRTKRDRENDDLAKQRLGAGYTPPGQIVSVQMGELERAMTKLPAEQRTTLILVALEDVSYEEAARITNIPIGTVRSRLSRAHHTLMNRLEGLSLADVSPKLGIIRRSRSARATALHRPSPF